MSLRVRSLLATVFLLVVAGAGAVVIVGNLRSLIANQQMIIFKDQIFHDHERARELIQSAQARLYQHQAGYTRDIDQLIDDIAEFETIMGSIVPHYRQHVREQDCRGCHDDELKAVDGLEETVRTILLNLDRYRESVSIIITTNDRQARLLHNGIANARGEEILATIQRVNASAGLMVQQLRAAEPAAAQALGALDRGVRRRGRGDLRPDARVPALGDQPALRRRCCAAPSR